MTFLTILGVAEIECNLRLVLKEKGGKEIPKSSRLEFLEKPLPNNFALLYAEDNTTGLWNRGFIGDLLLLRTHKILAVRQISRRQRFWEVMDFFALLAYASLPASRTFLQRLIVCLNCILDSEDLLCWYKQKK